jgi:hypothetical protein
MGGMMAAIFLVLAVVDAALLANVALTNPSATSVSVFDQSMTRFTQGELLLLAAGLGVLLALFVGIAWSSSSARRAKRRGLRVARWEREGRVAELERENARLRKELEGTRRTGVPVGPQGRPAGPSRHPGAGQRSQGRRRTRGARPDFRAGAWWRTRRPLRRRVAGGTQIVPGRPSVGEPVGVRHAAPAWRARLRGGLVGAWQPGQGR